MKPRYKLNSPKTSISLGENRRKLKVESRTEMTGAPVPFFFFFTGTRSRVPIRVVLSWSCTQLQLATDQAFLKINKKKCSKFSTGTDVQGVLKIDRPCHNFSTP